MSKAINFSKAEFITSVKQKENILVDKPCVAFLGRSNVGKSTLINLLVRNNNLMKTSKTPGLTKLINYVLIDNFFYLVDLPGYGYASQARDYFGDLINSFIFSNSALRKIYLLVDSRRLLMPADITFIESLHNNNISLSIVFTKIDKLNASDRHFLNIQSEKLSDETLFYVSSKNLSSIEKIRKDIINCISFN